MPTWDEIIGDVGSHPNGVLDNIRTEHIKKLSELRDRNVVCYYSGWLQEELQQSPYCALSDSDMEGFMTNIHGLDKNKGLDLVLHTPGGDLAAAESLVNYLRECFHNDVIAFVPHLCMSAGTMIACSCKEIYMGKQSSIGPTDPQFGGYPAGGVIEEFQQAVKETSENPGATAMWAQIIGKYPPTYLGDCQKAVDTSQKMVAEWLKTNMLSSQPDAEARSKDIAEWLGTHANSAMHNRHITAESAKDHGLAIRSLEENQELQDIVLTIHHAYMATFERSGAKKMIENSNGKSWIRIVG